MIGMASKVHLTA